MKHIGSKLLFTLLLLAALCLPALALEPGPAAVTADWLNFRTQPGTDSAVLELVPEGSVVEILEVLGDWCRVEWAGKEGYMSSQYLKQAAPASPITPEPAPEATPEPSTPTPEPPVEPVEPIELSGLGILTGDAVRFRAEPSLLGAVYGYLYCGTQVTVLAREGDWYQVEYQGRTGYLFGDYVKLSEPAAGEDPEALQQVLALAQEALGVSYVYGGASPSGFDCSGLSYYCFVTAGITMNRTASQQYLQGSYVEQEALQPGDLVFFSSPGTWSIGHVGIYIGDGSFIHASSGSGIVRTDRLDSWYYSTYYYGARRILA